MPGGTLFVTPTPDDAPSGGRAMLSRLILDCLKDCVDEVTTVRLAAQPSSKTAALTGFIDGVTEPVLADLVERSVAERIERIVLDGSNLGRIALAVKRAAPRVQILTFCHNVEARFFKGALAQNRSVRALGVLAGNYVAERFAARHSDRLITLSQRDSDGFRRWYGRPATNIFPMAMHDQLGSPPPQAQDAVAADAPALFVGGAFYANQQGVAWFAKHVAPHIGIRTDVIGRGMETMRGALERFGSVRIIGPADDLAPHYADARIVIAPIFDGSGMKTKVAEALMFGKRVIGTPEAFSGYEGVGERAGWVCHTAEDFIAAIAAARAMTIPRFDPALRAIYEQDYSFAAARRRMAAILAS